MISDVVRSRSEEECRKPPAKNGSEKQSAGLCDSGLKLESEHVLIVLHGSIGDVVRAIPLANVLKRHRPKLKLAWSVEEPSAALLKGHPSIDELLLFDRCRWISVLPRYLKGLRRRRFDVVLDLQRHFKSGLISWSTRAPVRLGFQRADAKEGNWLFNTHHIAPRQAGQSKLSKYLEFATLFGLASDEVEWKFRFQPEEKERAAGLLSGVKVPAAAFFVGASWPSKRWTPEQTAKLIGMVRASWGLDCVLLGGEGDQGFARRTVALCDAGLRNLVGLTTIRDLAGILKCSAFSVGPDTGAMHISAAVGTPVISLWGPTDPTWSGPFGHDDLIVRSGVRCGPCMKRVCKRTPRCMEEISLDQVMSKIETALRNKGNSPVLRKAGPADLTAT